MSLDTPPRLVSDLTPVELFEHYDVVLRDTAMLVNALIQLRDTEAKTVSKSSVSILVHLGNNISSLRYGADLLNNGI